MRAVSRLPIDVGACAVHIDADVNASCGLNAVVVIHAADVIGPAVFLDAVVFESRRAVDLLALHGCCINAGLGSDLHCGPRHRHGLVCGRGCARGSASALATGGFEHGVSHATGLSIEHHVLNDADFRAVGAANLGTNDLATRDVARRGS